MEAGDLGICSRPSLEKPRVSEGSRSLLTVAVLAEFLPLLKPWTCRGLHNLRDTLRV